MNSKTNQSQGSIYDTVYVARKSREITAPSQRSVHKMAYIYDAAQSRINQLNSSAIPDAVISGAEAQQGKDAE